MTGAGRLPLSEGWAKTTGETAGEAG
jgi:hypothetical protein